jgi:DNA-binding response OmpR family regulator
VTHAPTGGAAMEHIAAAEIDAVILDLMLPDMDGLDVCRKLRASSDVPVLMLTARGDAIDRIVGLEIGADDYLPKPFEPRELLARLRAILRRRVDVRHLDAQRGGAGTPTATTSCASAASKSIPPPTLRGWTACRAS